MELEIEQQHFILSAHKALFWKEQQMLIVGDLHLGKVAHFRKNGISLPEEIVQKDIKKIEQLLLWYKPKCFCVLGDLFHSSYNAEWNYFVDLRNAFLTVDFLLIKGNHDTLHSSFYKTLPMQVVPEFISANIKLIHERMGGSVFFQISAHLHPAYYLKGKAKQALRLACFYKKEKDLIIPSFGTFTGNFSVTKKRGEQIFAIAEDQIILC